MLGWLAAASAPWLIHLWNRRRYREVRWAAMQYLLAAMRNNARRIRIEQWLLLALRTAIIAILVTALAGPFLRRAGLALAAGAPAHKILVLDGSYSMAFRPGDRSRFERAKELASRIVDEGRQGDGFSLVLMSEPPRVVVGTPSSEPTDFLEEIANLQLPQAGGDLPATLALVEELAQRADAEHSRLSRREVFFLTDLGRTSWTSEAVARDLWRAGQAAAQRLAANAAVVIVDLGQPDSENVAITQLRSGESLVTGNSDVELSASVRNFGRRELPQQRVELYVDGRRAAESMVQLTPGGEATATFRIRLEEGGVHGLEARLEPDALEIDNRRWCSVVARDALDVLVVNGKPAGQAFRGASDYLAVALSPQEDGSGLAIRPQVVTESTLLELDLASYDCLFLCNVAQFTPAEARILDDYLKQGGGVVFFLGDQVIADNYNRRLAGDEAGSPPLLPARLGNVVSGSLYRLDPGDYDHPLIREFRGQERSGLLTTLVYQYFELRLPEEATSRVPLRFVETKDPALVEATVHRGRVILVATSADVSWNAMATWPSYVPLVHEILRFAIQGRSNEWNTQVGQPLTSVQRLANDSSQTGGLRLPSGETEPLRWEADGDRRRWIFSETWQSGLYQTEYAANETNELFAVNVDARESDLATVDHDELHGEVWPGVEFQLQSDYRDLSQSPQGDVSRRTPLHRLLLYCVLGLMLGETWLARRIGNRWA